MTAARPLRAVALGGGHGLQATLAALRLITDDVTAVVTVADDGGSSGRLRRDFGLLPPGDLRKALTALAGGGGDPSTWAGVLEHRFGGTGALAGHAVGNLVLAGLFEVLGDPVLALEQAARLLGVAGRVLPMCTEPLDIEADVIGVDEDPAAVRKIRGQVAVASTPGSVRRIRLHSANRPGHAPTACPAAVAAVHDADVVLLGPGSWFTSVLPHLLVPDLHEALVATTATRLLVLNLVPQPGETTGFSPERHLDVLCEHAPRLRIDAVIADADSVATPDRLRSAATRLGALTQLDVIAEAGAREKHDPRALAAALGHALAAVAARARPEPSRVAGDGEGKR